MTGAFIIEVSGEPVGLVLPDRRGYRLVVSTPLYQALDGASFRTVLKAQRAAEKLAPAQRRRGNAEDAARAALRLSRR
jgi:hypothetical protein